MVIKAFFKNNVFKIISRDNFLIINKKILTATAEYATILSDVWYNYLGKYHDYFFNLFFDCFWGAIYGFGNY